MLSCLRAPGIPSPGADGRVVPGLVPVVTPHLGPAAVDHHFGVGKATTTSGRGSGIAGQGPGVVEEGKPLVVLVSQPTEPVA